ncbi:MAG: hypothetical protein H6608_04830 [Flavobacteriales bacterium]|nr:hypothetical protein [Flavobacteriales bacterium]
MHIRHAVKSFAGCWDTTEFDLIVLRSVPDFEIGDSIGCAGLQLTSPINQPVQRSLSQSWAMKRDTTKETFTTDPFSHTYKQPGEYFIRLIGVDSFYDPFSRIRLLSYRLSGLEQRRRPHFGLTQFGPRHSWA